MSNPILEITVEETAGIVRDREPVTHGIPFPRGLISASSKFQVVDDGGNSVPVATTPLARWTDGSVKWMLFDFQVSLPAKGKKCLQIYPESIDKETHQEDFAPPKLHKSSKKISVRTGNAEFELDACKLLPFSQITVAGHPVLRENASEILLIDEHGREWIARIDNQTVETQNPLRMVLGSEGAFISGNEVHLLRYKCRIHFFAGKSTTRIDFTLWNPRAAHHPGGVWDLGDKGSVFFRELSLELATERTKQDGTYYSLDVDEPLKEADGNILIYQDSSGGENWRSHNHINRYEEIPLTFRGFEVRNGPHVVSRGLRATPCIALLNQGKIIAASVKHFWQNFPTALELDDDNLKIHLFPKYFNDLFELQGGEQKTHTIYVSVQDGTGAMQGRLLDGVHAPLIAQVSPEWYYTSGACPRPVPPNRVASDVYCSKYQQMVDLAIWGERSFFTRREIPDEYGWRNFGDIYGDHEAVYHKGKGEFVSHYNNQYDVIKGAIVQFMRTGEQIWFQLADELAKHVSDIDIYHTDQDRYEYNNGLFWHTDHHLDAATSTHRCISRKHREFKDPRFVGGGPSPAHNYATGFLYHYWLTGSPISKGSVLALAENVVKRLEGTDIVLERCLVTGKRLLKWLIKTLKRSPGVSDYEFDGPGRSSGNAVNTLLDAYLLSSDEVYVKYAEKLIFLCVSPGDNIEARDLLNAELRWMYNIFLQSLGRFLDIKHNIGQLDQAFWHARTVLLKYAGWMVEHEYPYLEKPEILEFPNETWAAQEIRKSDVLAYAAHYAPEPLRRRLMGKSRFFFEHCLNQLQDDFAETKYLTRVIAILMANGMVHMDGFFRLTCSEDIVSKDIEYTLPNADVSFQKNIVSEQLKRFTRMIKNMSFKKELRWVKQRLGNGFK